jgi:hypothetical protein
MLSVFMSTSSFAFFATAEESIYRVDFSIQLQNWAYPNEGVNVQGVTVLEEFVASAPSWTYVGNVPVNFEVTDSVGNATAVDLPQGLSSDKSGRFQFMFHAPEKEGNYTVIAHAMINGNTVQASQTFTVSSEQRPTQDPPVHTVTSSADVDPRIFIVGLVMIAILAILVVWRSRKE